MLRCLVRTVLGLLACVAPVASQGQVLVVDGAGGPGSDFTDLPSAVSAAADGDVLLLRSGDYLLDDLAIGLDGKGLSLVADADASVHVGGVDIQDLPATRFALLQGLTIEGEGQSVNALGDSGVLWFERCALVPQPGFQTAGAIASSCSAVVWSRCSIWNAPIALIPPPGPALTGIASRLHVFDTEVRDVGSDPNSIEPSPALVLRGTSFLELFGSHVLGLDGIDGHVFSCNGQNGGHAVALRYPGPARAVILGSVLEGGAGGAGFNGCQAGAHGEGLVVGENCSATELTGVARSLSAASPVREGQALPLTLTGKPGDRYWIRYAASPGLGVASPFYDGELLLGAPSVRFATGTVPGSGTLALPLVTPALPDGEESAVFFVQAVFRDADTGRFVLSSPSAIVALDEAF